MSKKIKIFLGVSGVLLILLILNIVVNPNKPSQNSMSSLSSTSNGATSLGVNNVLPNQTQSVNEFSDLLSSLRSITIDTSIFTNPNYKALRENSIILGSDTVGRNDPFAPAGADITDAGSVAPVKSTQIGSGESPVSVPLVTTFVVQTLSPDKITATTVLLSQMVSVPPGNVATVAFEYGTTNQFGDMSTTMQSNVSGVQSTTLKGLKPKTKYFVRAIGDNGAGSVTGDTMLFTTK